MSRSPIDRRSFCWLGAAALLASGAAPSSSTYQAQLGVGASLGGIRPFPETDAWNRDVSQDPVDPRSAALIQSIGLEKVLHADFGTTYGGRPIGIPYMVVSGTQPRVPIRFANYPEESDPGPYPIPPDAPVEGGADAPADTDRHVLVVDRDAWKLYEMHSAFREGNGWRCGSGAIFDLANNTNRPFGWTSADAAGLPVFPGLVRHDEAIEAGAIRHALRFTCRRIRRAYVAPARHYVNRLADQVLPPMGTRLRLRRKFDTRPFPAVARVILEALKTYGMLLADVGNDYFLSGTHDMRWDDEALGTLRKVKGSDFEVLRLGEIVVG